MFDEKNTAKYLKLFIQSAKAVRQDGVFILTPKGCMSVVSDASHNAPCAVEVIFHDEHIIDSIKLISHNNTIIDGAMFNRIIKGTGREIHFDDHGVSHITSKEGEWTSLGVVRDTTDKMQKMHKRYIDRYIEHSSKELVFDVSSHDIEKWYSPKGRNAKFTMNLSQLNDSPILKGVKLTNRMLVNLNKKRMLGVQVSVSTPDSDNVAILRIAVRNIDCVTIIHYAFLAVQHNINI